MHICAYNLLVNYQWDDTKAKPNLKNLVLAVPVVRVKARGRSRDEQVVKPIRMINKVVELMSRRAEVLANISSRTKRGEIVKQDPRANKAFSGEPVPVKETNAIKPTSQWDHQSINHIGGTKSLRMVKS